ncbi:sodium-coupled monocarboxylate transporter 1 [Rhipicephalus microplus]|uniref:sodium-coupled monocarboxylate transporter 1 n=1 Tax=Rhipicephalus microplus TaxID=6941 RepID=UPI003F6D9DF7
MINLQAAILYVDVISPRWKNANQLVLCITSCTALALGIIMTVYSTICVYMGSLSRVFLMVYSGLTSPFVGLCLLAMLFLFVHSKGAAVATIVTVVFQLWHITKAIQMGAAPPRMPVSLDYCPGNVTLHTAVLDTFEGNRSYVAAGSEEPFYLFRVSYYWMGFFGTFATIAIGVLISALTGESWSKKEQPESGSDLLVRIWRKPARLLNESLPQEMKTPRFDEHKCSSEDLDLLKSQTEMNV